MKMKKLITFTLLLLSFLPIFAQNIPYFDSIFQVLQTTKIDTVKADMLNEVFLHYIFTSHDSALHYAEKSMNFSKKIDYQRGIAVCYNNLGVMSRIEGNYGHALENLFKSLQINEKIKFKLGIANNSINIGLVHAEQKHYDLTLQYYERCLKIKLEINEIYGISNCYLDIGDIYVKQKKYQDAIIEYEKCLKIRKQLATRSPANDMAQVYNALGNTYFLKGDIQKAIDFFSQAVDILKKARNTFNLAFVYNNLGKIYTIKKQYEKAFAYFKQALRLAELHHNQVEVKTAYFGLADCCLQLENSAQGKIYFKLYAALQDSLFNSESSDKIARIQSSFAMREKQTQIELLGKDKLLQQEELDNQSFQTNVFVLVLVLMLGFAFFMYQNSQKERKSNALLKKQKIEIESQSKEIALQNQEMKQHHEELMAINNSLETQNVLIENQKYRLEITFSKLQETSERLNQSIRYAQNIQQAILPKPEQLSSFFCDHFIIYLPKDVVSGDFYWFAEIESSNLLNKKSILVLADCTGHGVPGAFMTMIGNTLLHETINIKNIHEPDQILMHIDSGIRTVLNQKDSKNYDGMDVGVCLFEKIENQQTKITFSGAKSSLFYIANDEILQLTGDRLVIGGKLNRNKDFTNKNLILPNKSLIYLSSDGFADQNDSERKS
ncbi:MAG: tetratricopeptide repeat protein, partial [Bacteroidetes bacterium]